MLGRYWSSLWPPPSLVLANHSGAQALSTPSDIDSPLRRVSVSSTGLEANGASSEASTSADGRYVVFESDATNLVPGDTNTRDDVFVYDRRAEETSRVSVSTDGGEGDGTSGGARISANGRYVAFRSGSTNLVAGDTNLVIDIFVHDRTTGVTSRVSVSSSGDEADAQSIVPSLSGAGRYVAFYSGATNLVAGDTNNVADVFVHDSRTGETSRVSVSSAGVESNRSSTRAHISRSGRYVAFESIALNLVTDDTNAVQDVFVHDRDDGTTARVSVSSQGDEGDGVSNYASISANGRYVAFQSAATDLVPGDSNSTTDVFVHDRESGRTWRVSVSSTGDGGNGASGRPSISTNGRFVTFRSDATNLVVGDTNGVRDVFVHDLETGETDRVSLAHDGQEGDASSTEPRISPDGRYVAFQSTATNLVDGDTNADTDVFATLNPLSPAAECNELTPTIYGTHADDLLVGAGGADVILGLDGNDVIKGLDSDDTICGGPGGDVILGGNGADWISGNGGADNIYAGHGNDTVYGNGGADFIVGGIHDDIVFGGQGGDQISGGLGDDIIYGGKGGDVLLGDAGDDILFGQVGADEIDCGSGTDIARGGAGTDTGDANCELFD